MLLEHGLGGPGHDTEERKNMNIWHTLKKKRRRKKIDIICGILNSVNV